MEITNEQIFKKLEEHDFILNNIYSSVIFLLRLRNTNKFEKLEQHLRICKSADVTAVRNLLGVSHPWALEIMKKLSNQNKYFKFVPGDKHRQMSSKIIFLAREEFNSRIEEVNKLVDSRGELTISGAAQHLGLSLLTHLEYISEIFRIISQDKEKYEYLNENKLVRVGY